MSAVQEGSSRVAGRSRGSTQHNVHTNNQATATATTIPHKPNNNATQTMTQTQHFTFGLSLGVEPVSIGFTTQPDQQPWHQATPPALVNVPP